MSFINFLLIIALATLALSAPNEQPTAPEHSVETFDTSAIRNLPQQLPLNIQLPRLEAPTVPFYQPQPSSYLSAPQILPNPPTLQNFYQVPIPSEFLTAPTEGSWNPNNDPALYYELPASLTKEVLPTSQFPKKFNKDVHLKNKPFSLLPKQEIALEPINESQFIQKQKDLFKTIEKLNKKENQKSIKQENKVPRYYVRRPSNSKTRPYNDSRIDPSRQFLKIIKKDNHDKTVKDSKSSDTTLVESDSKKYSRGLSPRIIDSLGMSSSHHESGTGKDRVLFQMVGQDGPMSYKWGYDTGKGHNRQFRFEERDKEGVVKGQYGYYDKEGRFRMMKYRAHPHLGFHMEEAPESETDEN
ncbi:hypothetical protein ABEB36_009171 [Hypothenemus hampei]|uniref:Uncharacterized protein n=1 Tax=Hypothenemus hampei TaxID=57062 RepID=A0ABD1EPD6_HYPHA